MIDKKVLAAGVVVLALGTFTALAQRPAANMSFFVTSSNPKGGNLGGLAGADAVCQSLAQAAGAGAKTWHAYLSTSTVDAKTRIGKGPWYNFKGDLIAQNVADLHTPDKNKISGKTSLTEKGTTPNYLSTNDKGEVQRPTAARHPDRYERGRHEERGYMQGLDGRRRQREGDARSCGSPRAQRGPELVERDSPVAGLRHGTAQADRRRGPALLLRDELTR